MGKNISIWPQNKDRTTFWHGENKKLNIWGLQGELDRNEVPDAYELKVKIRDVPGFCLLIALKWL